MIRLVDVTMRGESDLGPFSGSFTFAPGLQVISAHNRFGKSLAVTSIAWCLGLERMFGLNDNDPARFSVAVREIIELGGQTNVGVRSSEASLTLERGDGARVRITRAIKGDPAESFVEEIAQDGTVERSSRLFARKLTMKDETGGLHRFLFEWGALQHMPVMTTRGDEAELYLENIAPLFYIDQSEGWTDLQALQVHRYGLLEVSEIAVEYLLGATEAIQARFARQAAAARENRLKGEAAVIAAAVTNLFQRHGWITPWSEHGTVADITDRWSARTLVATLKSELDIDLSAQMAMHRDRADTLRELISKGDIDPRSTAAASDASQVVVELKEQRHARREELRILRRQSLDQQELVASIEHRHHSARDILRLKKEGIGRIEYVECPTCHRSIDPATFALTAQSVTSVQAHIDALSRDQRLIRSNIDAVDDQILRVVAELADVESKLLDAERALVAVNQAVGSVREQITKAATDLIAVEREIDKVNATGQELRDLQIRIDAWIDEARGIKVAPVHKFDLERRVNAFTAFLRVFLKALGHGELLAQPTAEIRLDERYIPYLGPRRLRSLGSASDQPRLIGAYTLALAAAAEATGGIHPGLVVLDEPLQQNPDHPHRQMFVDFLTSDLLRKTSVQTIIFTWLQEPELKRLVEANVPLVNPREPHFLSLVPPAKRKPASDSKTKGESEDADAGKQAPTGDSQAEGETSGQSRATNARTPGKTDHH